MSAADSTARWVKHDYDREAALDQWAAGTTAGGIAAALGVPLTTIRSLVKNAKERGDARVAEKHRVGVPAQWTQGQVDELRRLWATGISSAAIAREMGLTSRNAVLGKAHRLKLPARASAHRNYVPTRLARKTRKLRPNRIANPNGAVNKMEMQPRPRQRVIQFEQPTTPPVRFADIVRMGCRYVIGDPAGPNTLMCGARINRKSLCEHHAGICRSPAPPKRIRPFA